MSGLLDHETYRETIPESPVRLVMDGIIDDVTRMRFKARIPGGRNRVINRTFDTLADIAGVELIEPTDIAQDHMQDRCGEYVFGHQLGEPWCIPRTNYANIADLYEHTLDFLRTKKYTLVRLADMASRDVVAYMGHHPVFDIPACRHFAIATAKPNRVRSKMGPGPVIEHPAFDVPTGFGTHLYVLRKQS